MLRYRSLYIYRQEPGQTDFRLCAVQAPPPQVALSYSGLVADICLTPVPLRLDPMPRIVRQWRECGEHWLDLPAGPGVLLRFRLRPGQRVSARRLERLTHWAAGFALALA